MWVHSGVWYKLVKLVLGAEFFDSLPSASLQGRCTWRESVWKKNWSFILLVTQEADAQRSLKVKDRSRLYWKWFSAPDGRWLSEDEYSLKRPSFEVAAGVYPSSASLQWNMAGSSHSPHGTVKSFTHANEPRWHPALLYQDKHKVLTQITSAPEEHWTRSPIP